MKILDVIRKWFGGALQIFKYIPDKLNVYAA